MASTEIKKCIHENILNRIGATMQSNTSWRAGRSPDDGEVLESGFLVGEIANAMKQYIYMKQCDESIDIRMGGLVGGRDCSVIGLAVKKMPCLALT